MLSRRGFISGLGAAGATPPPLIGSIRQSVFWDNLEGRSRTWFHPRICRLPGEPTLLLMTLQVIGGSDYYGPVHWSESRDLGRTWMEPRPVPGLGRHVNPDGVEEGYCDTVPEHHARSGAVIAIAHNVYYKNGRLTRPDTERWPVYCVRSAGGVWGPVRKLEWDHPEASAIYSTGCSQRVTLPGGEVLVPLSFGPKGRPDRGAATVKCTFDGATLTVREHGNILRFSSGRGLLEPSLAFLDGVFYMTIRAENGQGFVTRSEDGLNWRPMLPWAWQDGEAIPMSSTQQRWLPHSEGLFLVYTRKDPTNVDIVRWRAPLWVAEVDRRKLALVRSSERVMIPIAGGEHQGNFHTTAISADESLVSTGTVVPGPYTGAVRMARIRWARPNRLV